MNQKGNGNAALLGCLAIFATAVIGLLVLISIWSGTWNTLNAKSQAVQSAKSQYSSALNICSEKIEGVWEIANQYMKHESETFRGVAEARSGYKNASEAFQKAVDEGKGTKELTETGTRVVQAALAFQIQIEAYPQLRAAETSQSNIRNMQEATNEIKTALDDWIVTIRQYNTYRGSFLPSIIGSFMTRFPSEYEYYEGDVTKLDVGSLNPENED